MIVTEHTRAPKWTKSFYTHKFRDREEIPSRKVTRYMKIGTNFPSTTHPIQPVSDSSPSLERKISKAAHRLPKETNFSSTKQNQEMKEESNYSSRQISSSIKFNKGTNFPSDGPTEKSKGTNFPPTALLLSPSQLKLLTYSRCSLELTWADTAWAKGLSQRLEPKLRIVVAGTQFALRPTDNVKARFRDNESDLPAEEKPIASRYVDRSSTIVDVTVRENRRVSVQLLCVRPGHVLNLWHQIWTAFSGNPWIEATLSCYQLMVKYNSIQGCPHSEASLHTCPQGRQEGSQGGHVNKMRQHRSVELGITKAQLHQPMRIPCKGLKVITCDKDIIHLLQQGHPGWNRCF